MYICTHCGWEGERKRRLRGSKTIEVLIWTTVILPGPLYSIWRRTGVQPGCPHCQMPTLVKENSDAGWLARRKFDAELGLVAPKKAPPKTDDITVFGNTKKPPESEKTAASGNSNNPAETPRIKKPVNPDEW